MLLNLSLNFQLRSHICVYRSASEILRSTNADVKFTEDSVGFDETYTTDENGTIIQNMLPRDYNIEMIHYKNGDEEIFKLENEILYGLKGEVSSSIDFTIPFGKANIAKQGTDATIVTYSIMLHKSLEAAKILKDEFNIEVEIIDLQSIRPIDSETIINSVKKTNRIVTVEESWPFASVGSEVVNIVQQNAFDYLDAPILKVNSADVPMPYSSELEKLYLPQVDDIVKAVKEVSYI